MACLTKLIVVDSYTRSRIREIRLDGHVHVARRNGRGKTTLIRLIPLFYGEQPSRLFKPTGTVGQGDLYLKQMREMQALTLSGECAELVAQLQQRRQVSTKNE